MDHVSHYAGLELPAGEFAHGKSVCKDHDSAQRMQFILDCRCQTPLAMQLGKWTDSYGHVEIRPMITHTFVIDFTSTLDYKCVLMFMSLLSILLAIIFFLIKCIVETQESPIKESSAEQSVHLAFE